VTTLRVGLAADVILFSAVWQRLAPADRPRAFRKLVSLLKSGGLLAITLRHGPADPDRIMYPVSLAEIERLARDHGLVVVHAATTSDGMGRPEVNWTPGLAPHQHRHVAARQHRARRGEVRP
jgi:predicted O-methyltransferase YrrM